MPGSTPPTSQLDWLISTTAMIVLSWSRATRDLLKSFGWGIRALHQLVTATMVPFPRRLPHTISPVEEARFEPSVPTRGTALFETAGFSMQPRMWGLRSAMLDASINRRYDGSDAGVRRGLPWRTAI